VCCALRGSGSRSRLRTTSSSISRPLAPDPVRPVAGRGSVNPVSAMTVPSVGCQTTARSSPPIPRVGDCPWWIGTASRGKTRYRSVGSSRAHARLIWLARSRQPCRSRAPSFCANDRTGKDRPQRAIGATAAFWMTLPAVDTDVPIGSFVGAPGPVFGRARSALKVARSAHRRKRGAGVFSGTGLYPPWISARLAALRARQTCRERGDQSLGRLSKGSPMANGSMHCLSIRRTSSPSSWMSTARSMKRSRP
jgi:hypothetical protein